MSSTISPRRRRTRRTLIGAVAALTLGFAGVIVPTATPAGAATITPAIAIDPGPSVIAPGVANARATILGSPSMTGMLTLTLYPPGSNCLGAPTASFAAAISGGTASIYSNRIIPGTDAAGVWLWQASYPGDAMHTAAMTPCVTQRVLPAGTPPWYPFASASAFVMQQFDDLLGRAPTGDELNTWTQILTLGSLRPQDLIQWARTGLDHQINVDPTVRLYFAYFLRIPDAGGMRFWIAASRRGRSLDSISQFFATSPEFIHRYGSLTDVRFVQRVYQNILGRPGEASGIAFWTDQLTSGAKTRGQVMTGFSEAPEYRRRVASEVTVAVLYTLLLGRAPTASEFAVRVAQVDAGVYTSTSLADDLRRRPEYAARFGIT